MPNLVGIGNSQVPTNAMLGGLAYQDTKNVTIESANIKNIDKLSNVLQPNTTLGHVFVYDTSRDSDGGAWRYRTQHTSWYNEPLGNTYRGNRREFPSVAILATHSGYAQGLVHLYFSIYDGDDPEFPLWMRFPIDGYTGGSNLAQAIPSLGYAGNANAASPGPIAALNGQIFMVNGTNSAYIGWMANMISEKLIDVMNYGNSEQNQCHFRSSNMSNRYGFLTVDKFAAGDQYYAGDHEITFGKSGITGRPIAEGGNDVDMFVEQFTSVDDETGLPYPSIALATDGGLTILRGHDKGWDHDTFGSYGVYKCSFGHKGDLISINRYNNVVQSYYTALGDAGISGTKTGQVGDNNDNTSHYYHFNLSSNLNPTMGIVYSGLEDVRLVPSPYGEYADDLWLIPSSSRPINFYLGSGRDNSTATSMGTKVHTIHRDAVTGYMPGDCMLAVLCECANGNNNFYETGAGGLHKITQRTIYSDDFTDTSGGWTFVNGTVSTSGGYLWLADVSAARATKEGFLTQGKKYYVQYKRSGDANNFVIDDDGAGAGAGSVTTYHQSTYQNVGTFGFVFTCTASNRLRIMRTQTGGGGNIQIENIRVYDISEGEVNCAKNFSLHAASSSNKNFGFAVVGELTRAPVFPGADLMCYSGWSSSNYLVRGAEDYLTGGGDMDYNEYGTSDFMWIGWVHPPSTSVTSSQTLIGVGDLSNNNGFKIGLSQQNGGWYLQVGYLNVNNSFASTNGKYAGLNGFQWNQFIVYKTGDVFRMYINGQYYGSTFGASTVNWTTAWGNGTGRPCTVIGGRAGGVGSSSQEWAHSTTKLALIRHGVVPAFNTEGFTDEAMRIMYEDEKQLFRVGAKCCLGGTDSVARAIDYDRSTNLLHISTNTERSEFRRMVRINRVERSNSLSYPKISAEGGVVAEVIQD